MMRAYSKLGTSPTNASSRKGKSSMFATQRKSVLPRDFDPSLLTWRNLFVGAQCKKLLISLNNESLLF